jgi:hypothetical protein
MEWLAQTASLLTQKLLAKTTPQLTLEIDSEN